MIKKYSFRQLNHADIDKAYSIICSRVQYLLSRNIKQYAEPYPPKELFAERRKKGHNFGLYDGNELTAIVSIIPNHIPDCWIEYKPKINFAWVTSLFSSEKHNGKNLGYVTMKEVEKYLLSQKIYFLLLDCYVDDGDYLVSYYNNINYKEIVRKEICYPTHTFTAALMAKTLETDTQ
ncbi:MAG TPA: GNAT family N-acetyltransferase [Ignavibacteriaceae bacterium]|nr:GNAT family N-acetyltransferase [Ignavibacteriaceae bacterium]